MNARLFRYASVGALLALSLGSALPTVAATPKPVSPAGPAPTSGPSKLPPSPGAPAVVGTVIYDSLISPQPPNVPSLGFQATQTSEFGDHIAFAGTARVATKVTVLMSAWALQSSWPAMTDPTGWIHPIKLSLYNVIPGAVPTKGAVIATVTQNFKIPWRPAADPTCPGGTAWRAADLLCYNGYAFPITFDLTSLNVTLPDEIIYGIAYNTNTWGANPIGVPGPYESLNVGLGTTAVSVGTDVNPDDVFWNTATIGNYTDPLPGLGLFRQDTGWSAYDLNVRFEATTPAGLVINPSSVLVKAGDPFFVDLQLNDALDVYGYQFTLNYPVAMATGDGAGSYVDAFFGTTEALDGVQGMPGTCSAGVCTFLASRRNPGAAVTGSGILAHVAFVAHTPGVYTLSYSDVALSDRDAQPLPVTSHTVDITVYGMASIYGTVKLQGRATPHTSGPVTLVDTSGLFGPLSVNFNATTGEFAFPSTVPALAAGTEYRLKADHTLYVPSQKLLTVTPAGTYPQPIVTLRGGDATNDDLVGIPDLSCIGGGFNLAPHLCGIDGSDDVNDDTLVNVFDLVLAGGNYDIPSPQVWP